MSRPSTVRHARRLRRDMTDAERKLWSMLGGRRLGGMKFRRQVPIGPYVADFLCYERRLVVEVDGGQHAELTAKRDRRRDAWLADQGFRVVRVWNNDVLKNLSGVCDVILRAATTPSPSSE